MPDIRSKTLDDIFGRSAIATESLLSDLRERIAVRVTADRRRSGVAVVTGATSLLQQFEPVLSRMFLDATLAAAGAGLVSIFTRLPPETLEDLAPRNVVGDVFVFPPPAAPPVFGPAAAMDEPVIRFPLIEGAIDDIRGRSPVTRNIYDQLSASERAKAFTVAGEATVDAVRGIQEVLGDVLASDVTQSEFKALVADRLNTSFLGPAHMETVFRTNIQTGFHRAHDRLADNPVVSQVFPYQAYLPIRDGRTRDEHLALGYAVSGIPGSPFGIDGTNIYRRNDPFWDVFTPPWGYNCRCGVYLLTIEAAARRGVKEAQVWLQTGIEPQLVSQLANIPFRPEPGFSGVRGVVFA